MASEWFIPLIHLTYGLSAGADTLTTDIPISTQNLNGFDDYKSKHPEFFPDTVPLDKQHNYYLAIQRVVQTNSINQITPIKPIEPDSEQDIEAEALHQELEALHQASLPPPRYVIQTFNQTTSEPKRVFDYKIFSDIIAQRLSIINFNNVLYIYDQDRHLYKENINHIETAIRSNYIRYDITTPLPTVMDNMLRHIKSMGCEPEFPFNNNKTCIPVENGILEINYETETITLLPHSPCHLFTYKLPVIYNPCADPTFCIPLLERMVDVKDVETLIQIPAQSLLQMQMGHSYKKSYILQGEAHAGKTSYLKLLYGIFGTEFTCQISLQQLCDNHFVTGTLEGKLLNIYDDLEDIPLNTVDRFKTMTGDCQHTIEKKFKSPYPGRITAVHCYSCNYPPEYPDKVKRDNAFWERWEYLKFPFEYPVNPTFYEEWYTSERMSSFLNAILNMMIRIRKNGLPTDSSVEEVMMCWSVNSDPLFDFLTLYFDTPTGKRMYYYSKIKLLDLYVKYCEERNIPQHRRKCTIKTFTAAIQQHNILPYRLREGKENYEVFSTTKLVAKYGIDLDYHVRLDF